MKLRLFLLTLIAALSGPAFAASQSVHFELSVGHHMSATATQLGTSAIVRFASESRIDQCTLRTADSEDQITSKLSEELSAILLPISVSHQKVRTYIAITRLVSSPTDQASVKIADDCSLSLVDSQSITVRRMLELPVGEAYEFKLPNGESVRLSTVVAGKLD